MINQPPRVAVILVNWNSADETLACIQSLNDSTIPIWRIYIVDNASTDSSVHRIGAEAPQATLLVNRRNGGYAAGFNLAWPVAVREGADFIWLLNNDTRVPPGTLSHLLEAANGAGPALLSPQIRYQDRPEAIWYLGGELDWRLKSFHRTEPYSQLDPSESDLVPIQWATGCSLFMPAEVVHSLGPMDERYFLYLEDVDWSLRSWRAGIPVYCVPGAIVFHGLAQSVGQLDHEPEEYYGWRNYYLLVARHGSFPQQIYAVMDLGMRLIKTAMRLTLFPSYRNDPSYMARTRGVLDSTLGRFGIDRRAAGNASASRIAGEVTS